MTDQPRYKDLTSDQQALVEAAMKFVDGYGAVCYAYGAGEDDEDPDTTAAFGAARNALVGLLARGLAEGRQEVELLRLLLEQAEQYARDLQDGTAPGLAEVCDPERPDRLENAFQVLFDLVEKYGGERMQEQQAMWGQIENAFEELAEAGIAEGRRQATEGWKREWRGPETDEPEFRLVGSWEPADPKGSSE